MIAEYILKIGRATESEVKSAFSLYLLNRFEEEGTFEGLTCPDGREPAVLAASSLMNVVFGEIDLERSSTESWKPRRGKERAFASDHIPEFTVQFASENASKIEDEIKRLTSENSLCAMLSGAAYNIAYARYVFAGGKRSIFSHPFLAYIRTLYRLEEGNFHLKTYQKICGLGEDILRPIEAMQHYLILRPFPHNPDERAYCDAVQRFAAKMQELDAAAKEQRKMEAERRKQRAAQTREKREDEYPTEAQIQDVWAAYKSGKPGAIAEALRKRQEERGTTDTPDLRSGT